MTNRTKGNILKAIAVTIDVSVPLAATLTQFPLWVEKSSEATMSGLFLIFAFLSCLPSRSSATGCSRCPGGAWRLYPPPREPRGSPARSALISLLCGVTGTCCGRSAAPGASFPQSPRIISYWDISSGWIIVPQWPALLLALRFCRRR